MTSSIIFNIITINTNASTRCSVVFPINGGNFSRNAPTFASSGYHGGGIYLASYAAGQIQEATDLGVEMGIVVGGIVLAVFLPIMKLQEALTPK